MKFYGNETETIVETTKGLFVIQSDDFVGTGREYVKIESLPENVAQIPASLCHDLIVPEEIK